MKHDLYISRQNYTLSDLLEAVDNKLKIETNQKIIISLKEIRYGYIMESQQYISNLIYFIIKYINKNNQSLTDIENIDLAQKNLILYHKDIKYYIKHYYNKDEIINMNGGKNINNKLIFNMKNLLSKNKIKEIEKEYAHSNIKKLFEGD